MLGHYWHQYWAWVGGNVGAMPLQAMITVAATLLLRRPIARAWHRLLGNHPAIQDARATAEAAHKIVADLYEHVTGKPHPDAPTASRE